MEKDMPMPPMPDMPPMMHMAFYQSTKLILLFSNLSSDEGKIGPYMGLLALVFFASMMHEFIGFIRKKVLYKVMDTSNYWKKHGKVSITSRILVSFMYIVQVTLAYGIMLCVMSFNGGVFIVTILGLTIGNFITNFMKLKKEISDFNENEELDEAALHQSGGKKPEAEGKISNQNNLKQNALQRQQTLDLANTLKANQNPLDKDKEEAKEALLDLANEKVGETTKPIEAVENYPETLTTPIDPKEEVL